MASDSLLASVNLVFDPRGPALICKTCQYALAVSKSQVTTHLWKKHGLLVQWLSRRCLYCYVYCAITKVQPSTREHWHEDCPRSGSIPADPEYDHAVDFQIEMDGFRTGVCHSCGKKIEECGGRSSVAVTCEYAEIMVHTVFMLHRAGWLKTWIQREGYEVSFGYVSLQKWLSEPSDKGGVSRNRVVEAFEAYAAEASELV